MSNSQAKAELRPSRLQIIKERGADAIPSLPKRGVQMLPIGSLVEDPKNERKTFSNMDGLIETVKAIGVIEAITVIPSTGEKYMIVTGHRRYRAAKAAGLQTIRAVISDPDEEYARRRKSIISNVQREDVPPVELAEALQTLLEEDKSIKTQRDLAKLIGKRESWISDMLRILSLPPILQEKLRTSKVPIPYDAVMRVARVPESKAQTALVTDILEGKSNREIREKIKQAKDPRAADKPQHAQHKIATKKATVVVRFNKATASKQEVIQALEEALAHVRA